MGTVNAAHTHLEARRPDIVRRAHITAPPRAGLLCGVSLGLAWAQAGPGSRPPTAMSSALSERQKEELNKSILDYLKTSGFNEAYDALRVETDQAEFVPDPKAKWAGLLEKKWTGVIRLQKKIMDLEARNAQLLEELSTARLNPASTRNNADWLPRAPARHTLTGHRSPITRVAFHPLYTVCASASEDASIKVWDWESGEHERTLKGHTKAVQDCDYDSKGLFLVSCSSDLTIKLWDVSNDYSASKTF